MKEKEDEAYARFSTPWWEILAYVVLILLAIGAAALHFPKWVAIPFFIAVLSVRFISVHCVHRKKVR